MKTHFSYKADCHGVKVTDQHGTPFQLVTLLTEDDEQWFEGETFSAHWLDEVISVLQRARDHLEASCHRVEHGYVRKLP
jgi:hypothetical protein